MATTITDNKQWQQQTMTTTNNSNNKHKNNKQWQQTMITNNNNKHSLLTELKIALLPNKPEMLFLDYENNVLMC